MLLQCLLLVATLAIIGSTLLTSTLVSAKAKFHATLIQAGRSAMTDATAKFVAWTQSNVRDNGIDQLSVWAAKPQASSRQPACGGETSAPGSTTSSDCRLFRTIEWNITGSTDPSDAIRPTSLESEATNLATAQDERRISATVNVAITDSSGLTVYSMQSRELTARIFHAFPYVGVTGERDASSQTGSIGSAEGDTGGFIDETKNFKEGSSLSALQASANPASQTGTTLLTTMDCSNSIMNSSPNPQLDNQNVMFARVRPFGNLAWVYEAPCKSADPVNPNTAPVGYKPPVGNTYGSQATYDEHWKKNDDNQSSFAR
jgi:hypothetical protein